jgi:hypothetical protein
MKIKELMRVLDILNVEPHIAELVEFAYYRGSNHDDTSPAPYNPLTTSEIVECAVKVWRFDANDVSENTIRFAREIERLTLER